MKRICSTRNRHAFFLLCLLTTLQYYISTVNSEEQDILDLDLHLNSIVNLDGTLDTTTVNADSNQQQNLNLIQNQKLQQNQYQNQQNHQNQQHTITLQELTHQGHTSGDDDENSIFDPFQPDPSCLDEHDDTTATKTTANCYSPPNVMIDAASCAYGGQDPSQQQICQTSDNNNNSTKTVDKHWGSDPTVLQMRQTLSHGQQRPPIFLLPGLASTRLVAWKFKSCPMHPLLSDIKVQDYVWLNINLLFQMGTLDAACWQECMTLGRNQTDTDDLETGCKLRPDEGLDAISSLAPGSLGSTLLVGGTNTVYAWLIQWLADNLGYDVTNIIGLPYDWRLSPNVMERRDGFLTLTRRRIEAAVKSNGAPGIMVAHSMGNTVFRYFLEWLRQEMREEVYATTLQRAKRRRAKVLLRQKTAGATTTTTTPTTISSSGSDSDSNGWVTGAGLDELWNSEYGPDHVDLENDTTAGAGTGSTSNKRNAQLWELAQIEGDEQYIQWLQQHIWTYVGLSAPLLGAVNPLRAVISGENMGLPISDEVARTMELTFGATHTVNPISSKTAFCDNWDDWDSMVEEEEPRRDLACLDDLVREIENIRPGEDPWENFPQLRTLLKDRVDWDSDFPMIGIVQEMCDVKEKEPCASRVTMNLGPKDAQTGELFTHFSRIWNEQGKQLIIKKEQLAESWWNTNVPNILNKTWDRPHIKNIIMAYGVDLPTEAGYAYRKKDMVNSEPSEFDGVPVLEKVIWEDANGALTEEKVDQARGKLVDAIVKKKVKREPLRGKDGKGKLMHSGDGTIPYLSLSWAHTWLLHAIRAKRYSEDTTDPLTNTLSDDVDVSHRPKGAMEWKSGAPPMKVTFADGTKKKEDGDTGTSHPGGTKYKPEMVRFHNVGTSRKTGLNYSTTVIEAFGVEHKETTRNYDILAACFTDVLKHMHEDFGLLK